LPFDLHHDNYQITGFYLSNILQFDKKHPFYDLLRNHILFLNNKKPIMRPKDEFFGDKNNTLEAKDFDKNQK
ncbi:MAG: hypothetical protein ACQBVK_01930, partial [Candidatus Phytoplasma sp. TWB_XP]